MMMSGLFRFSWILISIPKKSVASLKARSLKDMSIYQSGSDTRHVHCGNSPQNNISPVYWYMRIWLFWLFVLCQRLLINFTVHCLRLENLWGEITNPLVPTWLPSHAKQHCHDDQTGAALDPLLTNYCFQKCLRKCQKYFVLLQQLLHLKHWRSFHGG